MKSFNDNAKLPIIRSVTMPNRPLSERFDTSGEWYLPDAPDRPIAGSLSYTPDHTELHLNDAFRSVRGAFHIGDTEGYPLVYGKTRDGDAMTLVNAQRTAFSMNFGSGGMRQPERLHTSLLLVGAHLPANFAYPEMRCRMPSLQMWMSKRIVDRSFDDDQATNSRTMSYRVLSMPEVTTRVSCVYATLDWDLISRDANVLDPTSIVLTTSGWVKIRPDAPQPIEWYLEQIQKITTLLAFLAGASMSPDLILGSIGQPHRYVSVLVALRDAKYCQYTKLSDFYMLRGTMEVELAAVVARWFEIYPRVHMPSQLALSVMASEKLWVHVEFLSLIQALEGFHRALFDDHYTDDTSYEAVKKALGDAIPTELGSDHKAALRSRIRYGNEISLRKRLDALTELLGDPIRVMIIGTKGEVPQRWIDTRNYYTHWDEDSRANVLDGQGMYNANVRMRHLLRALYLNLMGMPKKAIFKSLCNASDSSRHLTQLNAIERRRTDPSDTAGVIMTVLEQKTHDEPSVNNVPSSSSEKPGSTRTEE